MDHRDLARLDQELVLVDQELAELAALVLVDPGLVELALVDPELVELVGVGRMNCYLGPLQVGPREEAVLSPTHR
tara:strand:+ start:558 stop:782 length:225 start_codon:yes stop_codon:yes gene_type:complete